MSETKQPSSSDETAGKSTTAIDSRFFRSDIQLVKVDRALPADFDRDAAYYGDMEEWKNILSEHDNQQLKTLVEEYLNDPNQEYDIHIFYDGVSVVAPDSKYKEWESCYVKVSIDHDQAGSDDSSPEGYRIYDGVNIGVVLKTTPEEYEKWMSDVYQPWIAKQEAEKARQEELRKSMEKESEIKNIAYNRYKNFSDGIVVGEYERLVALVETRKHQSKAPDREQDAVLAALERILWEKGINPGSILKVSRSQLLAVSPRVPESQSKSKPQRKASDLPSIPPSKKEIAPPFLKGLSLDEQRRALDEAWKDDSDI